MLLVGLSLGARYRWRTTSLTALLFLLLLVQFALAVVGFLGIAAVAGLHGINALLMAGPGIYLVKNTRALRRPASCTWQRRCLCHRQRG